MKKMGLLFLVCFTMCACSSKETEMSRNESDYTKVICTGPYPYYSKEDYPMIEQMDAISETYYDENDKVVKSSGGYTIELNDNISDNEIQNYKEKLKEYCPESYKYCNITEKENIITLEAEYSDEYLKNEIFSGSSEEFKNFMETSNENVICNIE